MRRTGLVLLLVFGAALVPAVAAAAPAWLAPTRLSSPEAPEGSRYPHVVMNARGDSATVFSSPQSAGGTNERIEVAVRPAGGSWGAPVPLSPSGVETEGAQVGIDDAGEVTVLWAQAGEGAYVLRSATSQLGSGWTAPVDVSAVGDAPSYFGLAVDAAGEAVAVYLDSTGMHSRARVTSRALGGSWSSPQTVSSEGEEASEPAVAIGEGGDAVVLWNLLATGIRAVERPAGGVWSKPVDVAVAKKESFYATAVTVAPDGEAVAVWRNAINGVGAVVESAAETGGAWSPPVELGAGFFYSGPPRVAIDPAGEAVAVWERSEAGAATALVAARPRGGGWSGAVELPRPDGTDTYSPDVAIDPAGQAVATWLSGPGPERILRGAVRPLGGGWGAPTDLNRPGELAVYPSLAADAHGDAVATWQGGTATVPQIEAVGLDGAGPELRSLSIPAVGTAGVPIAFSLDAVDVWSGPAAVAWSFGDGTSAAGANVTHAYAGAANYSIGVTAVDSLGNSAAATGSLSTRLPPPAARGVARGGRTAIVRKGRAALSLSCPDAQCTGLAELLVRPQPSSSKKAVAKRRRAVLAGKSAFSIAPASDAVVEVKLRASVLKRLRRSSRHQLKVRLQGEGVAAGAVTLRLPHRHRRR